jgi:hypothetical protein
MRGIDTMSDNWIMLIPEDPTFIPVKAKQKLARARLAKIAPQADEIDNIVYDTIQFFDCAANFERIHCPSCQLEISNDWWLERMDADYDGGFALAEIATPCCGAKCNLNQLVYDWPQRFGRYALSAKNCNMGKLKDKDRHELETILETKLSVVYQHI